MPSLGYEEEREKILTQARKKKRRIIAITIVASVILIAAFLVVCKFWLNLIGFSLVALLVLMGLTVKLGGQAVANVNQMQSTVWNCWMKTVSRVDFSGNKRVEACISI